MWPEMGDHEDTGQVAGDSSVPFSVAWLLQASKPPHPVSPIWDSSSSSLQRPPEPLTTEAGGACGTVGGPSHCCMYAALG